MIYTMNFFSIILCVMIFTFSSVLCDDQSKPNADEKCSQPPNMRGVNPMQCCRIPDLLKPNVVESCAKKMYGSEAEAISNNEPPYAPHIRCVTECIFNETGIMKDRQFMPNIAASMAKSTLGPKSIWIPFIEDALKTCDEYVKKAKFPKQKACGHMAAYIVACINTHLFKNCPESVWNAAGTGCTTLRETSIKCPFIVPMHA